MSKAKPGRLTLAGYAIEDLAPHASFEEVAHLLLHGHLPDASRRRSRSAATLADRRRCRRPVLEVLREAAAVSAPPADALRMAAALLSLGRAERPAAGRLDRDRVVPDDRRQLLAAAERRTARPGPVGSVACGALSPSARRGRAVRRHALQALNTYLITVCDHGLNASTFTARVIVSTRSDVISAITGAVGALKGPLHGGAPGPALEMVFEIGTPERAEAVIRARLERGERLMGFGHRVYRVRDPRADVLAAAAERFYASEGDRALYRLARDVEATALRLLREWKPERRLDTNVEFYTALLLHGLGLPPDVFTSTFAVGRVLGWSAHCLEQLRDGRLIRPQSVYVGPTGLNTGDWGLEAGG